MIAGLDPVTYEPFICSLDLIGCPMTTDDFVVSGTCSEQMYGMCESLWEPDMVSAVQRRCNAKQGRAEMLSHSQFRGVVLVEYIFA